MSKFAVCIGCHALTSFIRLNVTYLRRVFGEETPILLYDSPSNANDEIKEIADENYCAYFCERIDRGHFGGDLEAAICAISFAQHHKRDIGIKLNQRTILLSREIPKLLSKEFRDKQVTLVTPGKYPAESIHEPSSRFHEKFPFGIDLLAFRATAWDAPGVAERYKTQWTTGTSKFDVYAEHFWANESKRIGPSAHKKADWITAHKPGEPFKFLRKIQNRESDYSAAAIEAGLKVGSFATAEWSKLKENYRPAPRA